VSDDKESWTQVLQEDIEHRAGDHLFTLKEPVTARYVKYVVVSDRALTFHQPKLMIIIHVCSWKTTEVQVVLLASSTHSASLKRNKTDASTICIPLYET